MISMLIPVVVVVTVAIVIGAFDTVLDIIDWFEGRKK